MPEGSDAGVLRYPNENMSEDEKKAWLDHQRDRWTRWAGVLNRIKEDEQRWLKVAFLLYGALLAFFSGSLGSAMRFDTPGRNVAGLLIAVLTVHGAAWAWTMQALNLRTQYYRTMARLFAAELGLGLSLPKPWQNSAFDKWREEATLPLDSKHVEMLLLGGLVCATGVLASYRFTAGLPFWRSSGYYVAAVAGYVSSLAGFAWPLLAYPRWDRRLLKAKLFHQDGPVQDLQRRAGTQ